MKKNRSSITARGIAMLRAYESEKPAGERICYDPYARRFIGNAFYHMMKLFISTGYAERRGPGTLGFLVARCRYIDDYLLACLDAGIQQLVILGAGLDSRAYRFEQLKGRVKVFEVDHPATQKVKLDKLRQVCGTVPDYVTYVPVDFDAEMLEKLFACGYDRALKTLFIWEGVTYYITPEAVDGTLRFVAQNSGAGSSIIFDYTSTDVVEGRVKRSEPSSMRRYERLTGEAMHFGIPEGQVKPFLEQRGFFDVVNITGEDLKRLYFTGVNSRRAVASVYSIAHAEVKVKPSV
jgi:methyltransferase (TIGR00027 family)